jgi:RimJ/RimL family protein N-acetyltransferase
MAFSNQLIPDSTFITTTLPILEHKPSKPIITDRLIIRPLVLSDLETYHTLISQPEAMSNTDGLCQPVVDMNETWDLIDFMQTLYYPFISFGIFLKKSDGNEGDLIDDGGVHNMTSPKTGWPEFGYKFKKELWGKGYATEFANAFLQFWWSLPRILTRIQVNPSSIDFPNASQEATELVYAWTTADNLASQRVMQKVGFESYENFNNRRVHW